MLKEKQVWWHLMTFRQPRITTVADFPIKPQLNIPVRVLFLVRSPAGTPPRALFSDRSSANTLPSALLSPACQPSDLHAVHTASPITVTSTLGLTRSFFFFFILLRTLTIATFSSGFFPSIYSVKYSILQQLPRIFLLFACILPDATV